jgi:FecR protein
MRIKFTYHLVIACILVLTACQVSQTSQPSQTQSTQAALTATLKEVEGTSDIKQPGDNDFSPASVGMTLQQNGSVQTGDDGRVRIDLSTGTIIRVAPFSLFTFSPSQSANSQFNLSLGNIFIILNGGQASVNTPSGTASVRGSYLGVFLDSATGNVIVTCLEGHCSAGNNAGSVDLTTGQMTALFPRDPATGQYKIPIVGSMTLDEYQQWLDNSPEAQQSLNLSATLTAIAPSATPTFTPTVTDTAAPTNTETPTVTPTPSILKGTVTQHSYCYYGPSKVYLYDYGINAGAAMQIIGRNVDGTWLYIQASGGKNPCWIDATQIQVDGEVMSLANVYPAQAPLPKTPYTKPPTTVKSSRSGNVVTLSWSDTYRRPDLDPGAGQLKYVVEAWHCVGGQLVFNVYGTNNLSVNVPDESGCSQPSSARIFVQDKEGFTAPETIPWTN